MNNRYLVRILTVIVGLSVSYSAQLQWRLPGGNGIVSELIIGQSYELYAVGVEDSLDGWVIDFSGSTSSFTSASPATRPSESFSKAWNETTVPLSRGDTFFEVFVDNQIVGNFVHDVDLGPELSIADNEQFLCVVVVGELGILTTEGQQTQGLGQTDLTGITVNVVAHSYFPGDLNQNGSVDMTDFAVMADNWNSQDCSYPDNCGRADIDLDGIVDIDDLTLLASFWLAGSQI